MHIIAIVILSVRQSGDRLLNDSIYWNILWTTRQSDVSGFLRPNFAFNIVQGFTPKDKLNGCKTRSKAIIWPIRRDATTRQQLFGSITQILTNIKSHAGFRPLPKSGLWVALNGRHYALFYTIRQLSDASNPHQPDPHCQRQNVAHGV